MIEAPQFINPDNISENQRTALRIITDIFSQLQVPYQIGGDVAAIAHGALKELKSIDIDVKNSDFEVVNGIFRLRFLGINHILPEIKGVPINLQAVERRIYTTHDDQLIDFRGNIDTAQYMTFENIVIPVMNLEDLIKVKSAMIKSYDPHDTHRLDIDDMLASQLT